MFAIVAEDTKRVMQITPQWWCACIMLLEYLVSSQKTGRDYNVYWLE